MQRPLPDNTQHPQETDINAPGGFQTRSSSTPVYLTSSVKHDIYIFKFSGLQNIPLFFVPTNDCHLEEKYK